jgi:hypothetical protein
MEMERYGDTVLVAVVAVVVVVTVVTVVVVARKKIQTRGKRRIRQDVRA